MDENVYSTLASSTNVQKLFWNIFRTFQEQACHNQTDDGKNKTGGIIKYPGIQFRLPCTPPPGQFFMGAKLFIGTPWMGNEGVLKKMLVWAM